MQREGFSLFESEEDLLDRVLHVLGEGSASAEALRAELALLAQGYRRLFRETQRLIKLSDRKEEELNRLNRELAALSARLEHQATHDALTGILNKGALTRYLVEEQEAVAYGLLLFDIDHFKQVNDRHGHPVGDAVLQSLVARIQGKLPAEVRFGRFGGEEFAIVLPHAMSAALHPLAERLREVVAAEPFVAEGRTIPVTISLGATLAAPGEPFSSVYSRADDALYRAKQGGRNRGEIA
jgi:diguanylate cyclase (GGDEF)-like protein